MAAVILSFAVWVWAKPDLSVAWFSRNTEVNATDMSISINGVESKEISFSTYLVSDITDGTLYFDTANPSAGLIEYDILDDDGRWLLLKIELPIPLSKLTVNASTETTGTLTGFDINGSPLSYAVKMQHVTPIAETGKYTVAADAYNYSSMHSFGGITSGAGVNITNPNIHLFDSTNRPDEYTELFLLITYNIENISALYGNPCTFICDIVIDINAESHPIVQETETGT